MKRRQFSEEEKERIIYEYTALGYARNKIRKEFGVSDNKIRKVLLDSGIELRNIQQSNVNKYNINHNFFDTNNQTKDMAYTLGLISSDGCVSGQQNMIYIELQRSDRNLLEKVNFVLENERPVKDYVTSSGYENAKLWFYSRQMKDDLRKYNVVPNKTYSEDFRAPSILKNHLFPEYLRGYFDGNGSIKHSRDWSAWQIDTPSKEIALYIQKNLLRYGIGINIQEMEKVNVCIYRCITYKQANLKKIYSLLYNELDENSLFLQRKHDKFTDLLKMI